MAPAISFAPSPPNATSITAVATRSCAANCIPLPHHRPRRLRSHQRQHTQIHKVASHIQQQHHPRTQRQAQRQVALRVLNLPRRKRNVVPAIRTEQRAHLHHRQRRQPTHHHRRTRAPKQTPNCHRMQPIRPRPERMPPRTKIRRHRQVHSSPRNPTATTPSSAATFAVVKTFCTAEPSFTPRVFKNVNAVITTMATRLAVLNPTFPRTKMHDPIALADARKEHPKELPKRHPHRRHRAQSGSPGTASTHTETPK